MTVAVRRRPARTILAPLSPQRKWRAITFATLVLVPAFWSMLAGFVAMADDDAGAGPNPGAAVAFGLCLVPFVFLVLAFASEHPKAPGAVVKAMGLTVLVGITVSAVAADAATGLVAGIGAGGIVALRMDADHTWRSRAVAVLAASVYTFVLLRAAGAIVLLPAPIFPFTAIGLADHVMERRSGRRQLLQQPG